MERLEGDDLIEAARRARAGDVAARNRIVEAHMHLAKKTAWELFRKRPGFFLPLLSVDDLIQVCGVGLMTAAKGWNPDRSASFTTYAIRCMRHAVGAVTRRRKLPVERHPTYALAKMAPLDRPECLDALIATEGCSRLIEAFDGLDRKDRELMIRRHGWDGSRPVHINSIARWMRKSPEEVAAACAEVERRLAKAVG